MKKVQLSCRYDSRDSITFNGDSFTFNVDVGLSQGTVYLSLDDLMKLKKAIKKAIKLRMEYCDETSD